MRFEKARTKRPHRDITILEIGELKEYRKELGLSRKVMADKLGIAYRTFIDLENCNRDPRTTIARLAWLMVENKRIREKMHEGRHPQEKLLRQRLEDVNRKLDVVNDKLDRLLSN